MHLRAKILLLITLLTTPFSWGQLVTNSGGGPNQLVQNVLIGNGISASNIQYTGNSNAIGYFDGSSCNIGLDEGIILTTGTIYNTTGIFSSPQGPHGPNNTGSAGKDNGGNGLQSLEDLSGNATYDAVLLEFDFVPLNDTVQFNYVFASEEYLEFVDAGYNDVFAFFISGPGFNGTYNMAQIPNTNTPVTIDNINATSYSSYYVDNGDGSQSPQNSNDFYVQYDGFTIPMTAFAEVQCGETYHLQIALADAGDGQYDSGIFLEANSLTTPTTVDVEDVSILVNDNLQEGCSEIVFEFSRFGNLTDAMDIDIEVTGTATNGTDYAMIPNLVTFSPGQSTFQISSEVFYDGVSEVDETVSVKIFIPDPCNNIGYKEFNFTIKNTEPIEVDLGNGQVTCSGDGTILSPTITGGANYTYLWSTGETTPEITVNPTQSTNYWVKVTDNCLNMTDQANATVDVPVYPPINQFSSNDTAVLCPLTPLILFTEANGGAGDFTYSWESEGAAWSGAVQFVDPFDTQEFTAIATDKCGEVSEQQIKITVIGNPMEVVPQADERICPNDTVALTAQVQYGRQPYTYLWHHSGETTSSTTVHPSGTTTYVVEMRDSCDTYSVFDTIVVNVVQPEANFQVLSNTRYQDLPIQIGNFSIGGNQYFWDFGNGERSTVFAPNTIYDEPGDYVISLIVMNDLGCTDTVEGIVTILPEFYLYVPNAFTPDGNDHNNYFSAEVINSVDFNIKIFNRWGEVLFEANDPNFQWDGTYVGLPQPDGVYVYLLKATSINGDLIEKYGTVTLLR